jgi:hypothetical protein
MGLRAKASAMLVPMLKRRLCSAAKTSGKKGSCAVSKVQSPSKPISSAERASPGICPKS